MASNAVANGVNGHKALTNYVAYVPGESSQTRIGHLDLETNEVIPLSYVSGTPLRNLYEVIQVGRNGIVQAGQAVARSEVKLLPPIYGRDILAVGKNYAVCGQIRYLRNVCCSADHARHTRKNSMPRGEPVHSNIAKLLLTSSHTDMIARTRLICQHIPSYSLKDTLR